MAGAPMGSSSDKLSPLQRALLEAFFRQEKRYFLTGGAALAGFHLGHRATDDLDLFTHEEEAFAAGGRALQSAAAELGAEVLARQDSPAFRRCVVSRGTESVVVDLVWERVPSVFPDKEDRAGIRIDPLDEILANKLCAVLSRSEERDLVDLLFLERAGYPAERGLEAALRKDGGCTPAALAYVLSQIDVPDGIHLPADVEPPELRAFLSGLVHRLRRAAIPRH
jgi:predicted nucleotidyltransferase component of viral defense system